VLILSAEQISKSYSERILLKDVSLSISDGDRIGVIGVNGTGKSTLLKILAGMETPDAGRRIVSSIARIDFLVQEPDFEPGMTVLEHVFSGDSPEMTLLRDYEDALEAMHDHPGEERYEKRLISLSHQMDLKEAWGLESEAKTILTKLGITGFHQDVGTLSGGMKKRVAMAAALIRPCELLILDEPTNHIDNDTVDWLEGYLARRKGALLLVTHDRYFLERVANRIVELDHGTLFTYQANYSRYLEMRIEREDLEQAAERKRMNLFKTELAWIRRGARARTTKQKARIDRFEDLKETKAEQRAGMTDISLTASRLGRKIIDLEDLSKGFGEWKLFEHLELHVLRDDRIGILGPNGCGKSTLLNLIAGRLLPDTGEVQVGDTVRIGFFTQENEGMKEREDLRVLEYIRDESGVIETKDGSLSAAQMLERFLFPPEAQWTQVSRLSGGEKRRLFLLRILMNKPNILLMDEPTNDLDIQTLAVLEAYLDEFPGAVITVSHDRYFLDRIAEKVLVFDGLGGVKPYAGNYSDWRDAVRREAETSSDDNDAMDGSGKGNSGKSSMKETGKIAGRDSGKGLNHGLGKGLSKEGGTPLEPVVPVSVPKKFTFKEQREFESIDALVETLEASLAEANRELEAAMSDFERLPGLLSDKASLEAELENAVERWAYLHEISEAMQAGK